MALNAYYIEEEMLDGDWLVLDRPGGDILIKHASEAAAIAWVRGHHPKAEVHVASGVGKHKWDRKP